MARIARKSAVAAACKIAAQSGVGDAEVHEAAVSASRRGEKRKTRADTEDDADACEVGSQWSRRNGEIHDSARPKRRKTKAVSYGHLFSIRKKTSKYDDNDDTDNFLFPGRRHALDYHRPLLLLDTQRGHESRRALLAWYDESSAARGMPWRKPWLDPKEEAGAQDAQDEQDEQDGRRGFRQKLAVRAYEVWISEIMAQQTRIPVVIDYWTRWTARWPTMADLAAARPEDVLAAWKGLGYYSRATRLHAAARAVVAATDLEDDLLPSDPAALQARIPGVGRYTAGAIAAIVFGRPAAMVDGNVIRVLCRQMGLYADTTANKNKAVMDLLWGAAEALVRVVAREDYQEGHQEDHQEDHQEELSDGGTEPPPSDRPGRWGQALMELGSTVCTPKPRCDLCPIRSTCRAFAEGTHNLSRTTSDTGNKTKATANSILDVEDVCTLCEPFPAIQSPMTSKQTLSPFFPSGASSSSSSTLSPDILAAASEHARLFPLRRPKKAARSQTTVVCAVRTADGRHLLQRRPERGLLAGLWQLPSRDWEPDRTEGGEEGEEEVADSSESVLMQEARTFYAQLLAEAGEGRLNGRKRRRPKADSLACASSLGTIPWLFSHIRQTMHVFCLDIGDSAGLSTPAACCWVRADEVNDGKDYTMSTGMQRCWDLVQAHEAQGQ